MVTRIAAKTVVFVILPALCLGSCGRFEHDFNKLKMHWSQQSPAEIAVHHEDSEHYPLEVATLLTDLYLPWAVSTLPDNTLLITEKNGALYHYDIATGNKQGISGLPDSRLWGQGGLMDVVPHPDFASNRWIYLSYTQAVTRQLAATTVARAKLKGDKLTELQELFVAEPALNSGAHFGSALVFDDRQRLYITSGERGERPLVQQLDNHIGKIIRLNDDGTVPADNPFVEVSDAKPEIYSYGHRNPQGIAVEPRSGEIWSVEHGPRGGDEVNRILPGRNYGWPVISHGVEYDSQAPIGEGTHKEGMEQPLYYYKPSIGTTGMQFYTGDVFTQWRNDLFIGAIAGVGLHLNRLSFTDEGIREERLLGALKERVRDVTQGLDGYLYVITDSGKLLRIKPRR